MGQNVFFSVAPAPAPAPLTVTVAADTSGAFAHTWSAIFTKVGPVCTMTLSDLSAASASRVAAPELIVGIVPVGYRPSSQLQFIGVCAYNSLIAAMFVLVNPTGEIVILRGDTSSGNMLATGWTDSTATFQGMTTSVSYVVV